jgi:hypothetical protein
MQIQPIVDGNVKLQKMMSGLAEARSVSPQWKEAGNTGDNLPEVNG